MRIDSVRIYDYARIEHAVGIERAFELRESLDQLRPEHLGQEFGARPAVTMLAGKRAAELDHQAGDLFHRGAKPCDAGGAFEIEIDPAMDASVAEVAVIDGGQEPMRLEQGGKAAQIRAELDRRDRDVFGTRPGARIAGNHRARAQTGVAKRPNAALLALVAQEPYAETFRDASSALAQSCGA